jgi:hypothetical protein
MARYQLTSLNSHLHHRLEIEWARHATIAVDRHLARDVVDLRAAMTVAVHHPVKIAVGAVDHRLRAVTTTIVGDQATNRATSVHAVQHLQTTTMLSHKQLPWKFIPSAQASRPAFERGMS